MKLRKRSAIPLCIMAAAFVFAAVRPVLAAPSAEARAAQREEALQQIVRQLEENSVRPVEKRAVERDAKRLLGQLTAEQIEALAGGEDLDQVRTTAQPERAVAGDGGLQVVTAPVVGDATSDLLFVPVPPCRVIDTRIAGGMLSPGVVRDFEIAGTANFESQGGKSGGCGIPLGASSPQAAAVMINFVAISPQGSGNLRAWEFGQSVPLASVINYDKLSQFFNIANGVIVPIAGVSTKDKDLSIRADFNGTQLVGDVTGYFTRFPVESFQGGLKSSVQTQDFTTLINLGDGACHELNSCTVDTDVPGTVVVEAWGQFVMEHVGGTLDRVAVGVETAATVSCLDPDSVQSSDWEVPASLGSNPDVDFTISHGTAFTQPGGTTRTYRLSGKVWSGASTFDKIENSRLICTFIPD
ncbi:MAG TPA: hypothetical protein VKM72_10835 [Thermoanaerobaculia bacterium]|nr:hypothetical protein [Thermoanaerobaculia bacterium]